MAKDARIRGQEEEDDNRQVALNINKLQDLVLSDEPDHGKPPDQIASPTRDPPKSILKATRVTFGKEESEENSVAIAVKDSIDEVV